MKAKRYIPDISQYMAQCEMNYALFLRLLNIPASGDCPRDFLAELNSELLPFEAELIEQSKYTTTLLFSVDMAAGDWINPVTIRVRLYHDARLAEVLESNRNHAPKATHNYPNGQMRYPDDKQQRNQLLNECLIYCVKQSGCYAHQDHLV